MNRLGSPISRSVSNAGSANRRLDRAQQGNRRAQQLARHDEMVNRSLRTPGQVSAGGVQLFGSLLMPGQRNLHPWEQGYKSKLGADVAQSPISPVAPQAPVTAPTQPAVAQGQPSSPYFAGQATLGPLQPQKRLTQSQVGGSPTAAQSVAGTPIMSASALPGNFSTGLGSTSYISPTAMGQISNFGGKEIRMTGLRKRRK